LASCCVITEGCFFAMTSPFYAGLADDSVSRTGNP
jgi:hypothetical protein